MFYKTVQARALRNRRSPYFNKTRQFKGSCSVALVHTRCGGDPYYRVTDEYQQSKYTAHGLRRGL